MPAPFVTRFAPSPSGHLHLGHAFSAITAHDMARAANGEFHLRIENIDTTRCKAEFEASILEDIEQLGLTVDGPIVRQSERLQRYQAVLDYLASAGLTYPCFCTRAEIMAEIADAGSAAHGAAKAHYPGTCRTLSDAEVKERLNEGKDPAIRLNINLAAKHLPMEMAWEDEYQGQQKFQPSETVGDIVLARKDIGTSYHLSVVVDDNQLGVTDVVRGVDLFNETAPQVVLHSLLNMPQPRYHHHALITDETGRRLAKRDKDMTLQSLWVRGLTGADVRAMLADTPKSPAFF